MIFHLVPQSYHLSQPSDQPYVAPSLAQEGFIHCTAGPETLVKVANAYFAALTEPLLCYTLDPAQITAPVVYEAPIPPAGATPAAYASTDDLFPHVYGPINREAITEVITLRRDKENRWSF